MATVIDEKDDGSLLLLDDGTFLLFSSYDAGDIRWWIPPYKVFFTDTYMWNLENQEKVWIESIK